jgi:hypothetical protein
VPVPASKQSDHSLRVILLVAQEARRRRLRALVRRIDLACRVENASSPVDASSHLAREHADLLVLDLAVAQGQPLALIHHLARFAPSTLIVAFDESATRLPIRPYDVWSWDDADKALRQAIDTLKRSNPEPSPSAP